MRKINLKIVVLTLSLSCIIFLQMSFAQVSGDVHIHVAPPRPHHEVRGERPDHTSVWIGGYHEYDPSSTSYHWREGHWDHPPHEGAVWVAPRYKRVRGEYRFSEGRWK